MYTPTNAWTRVCCVCPVRLPPLFKQQPFVRQITRMHNRARTDAPLLFSRHFLHAQGGRPGKHCYMLWCVLLTLQSSGLPSHRFPFRLSFSVSPDERERIDGRCFFSGGMSPLASLGFFGDSFYTSSLVSRSSPPTYFTTGEACLRST